MVDRDSAESGVISSEKPDDAALAVHYGQLELSSGQSGKSASSSDDVAATVKMRSGEERVFRGIELPEFDMVIPSAITVEEDFADQNADVYKAGSAGGAQVQITVGRITRRSDGFGGYGWLKSLF